jgi:hypothetical protein
MLVCGHLDAIARAAEASKGIYLSFSRLYPFLFLSFHEKVMKEMALRS